MIDSLMPETPGSDPGASPQNPQTAMLTQHYEHERPPIDSVLLIDGDNDPHIPPNARVTPSTLVRVFLRPGALLPRSLERAFMRLPHFATVYSPKGGANAADFVMSLHAGMLHATLPASIPFLIVTNDATLSAMAAELERLGRLATLWTSHPDRLEASARATNAIPSKMPRRGGRISRPRSAPSIQKQRRTNARRSSATPTTPTPTPVPSVARPERSLSDVVAAYAARLRRIKDPPSRLKTLLNDIKNRAGHQGHAPEIILEKLKFEYGVAVDAQGRVSIEKTPPSNDAI